MTTTRLLEMLHMDFFGPPTHYSFVSSFEPFKVEDALRDLDWVVAMQEELSNFKSNELWSLVERPKQNVVGTRWVFCNRQDEHGVVTRNKA
jgi:hypothetical protein